MIELMHGDCLERLKELPDNSVDLTVTSPPYDNLRTYNGYTFDFEGIAAELYRVTKQGGVVVWVVGDATINGSETGTSFRQALHFKDVCGFNLHDTMVYRKAGTGACGSNYAYWQAWEFMFVLSKGKPSTINRISTDKPVSKGGSRILRTGVKKRETRVVDGRTGVRDNVWTYSVGAASSDDRVIHPAKFPEALARDHILSWSNEGDTVLDPFLGSGTTGKMAVVLNRDFIGIEISDEYLKIASERIEQARADAESNLLAVLP